MIVDRTKDVIKSGGEWISSVELENAIMAHPDVQEAAVIAVAHPKWMERPVAYVVPRPERTLTSQNVLDFLRDRIATVDAGRDTFHRRHSQDLGRKVRQEGTARPGRTAARLKGSRATGQRGSRTRSAGRQAVPSRSYDAIASVLRRLSSSFVACARPASRLGPLTSISIGVKAPKLMTLATMSAG